jgi:hypothetical protein
MGTNYGCRGQIIDSENQQLSGQIAFSLRLWGYLLIGFGLRSHLALSGFLSHLFSNEKRSRVGLAARQLPVCQLLFLFGFEKE